MIVAALVLADLCGAPPAPAAVADPDDAASYVAAANEARAAGDERIAALAYRKALAVDPGNTAARSGLEQLCAADRDEGDNALLAAIAQFRAGDLDAAGTALAAIVVRGGTAAAAHFFLGLIALREHDGATATVELELARRDPDYRDLSDSMHRLAAREGRLSAVILAAPEIDSNPQLLPDTPPTGATLGPPVADENLLIAGTFTARPSRWLVLRDSVTWTKQRHLDALDFFGENAQAGLEIDRHVDHVTIRYDFDYDVLEDSSYLIAHRGTAAYRHDLALFALGARYTARHRDFRRIEEAAFTGWVHEGEVEATLHARPDLDVELQALGWREMTDEALYANNAAGGRLMLRAGPFGRFRAAGSLAAWSAMYDAPYPDGRVRRDVRAEASIDLELDLADHVMAIASTTIARNTSTIEDFRYWKIIARVGIAFAFGGL